LREGFVEEPLVRTVPRQAFLAAIDGGLEKWMKQEERTPGKATPGRALTTAGPGRIGARDRAAA
jgi:hypothetical protein